jgi:hypothetical protein
MRCQRCTPLFERCRGMGSKEPGVLPWLRHSDWQQSSIILMFSFLAPLADGTGSQHRRRGAPLQLRVPSVTSRPCAAIITSVASMLCFQCTLTHTFCGVTGGGANSRGELVRDVHPRQPGADLQVHEVADSRRAGAAPQSQDGAIREAAGS